MSLLLCLVVEKGGYHFRAFPTPGRHTTGVSWTCILFSLVSGAVRHVAFPIVAVVYLSTPAVEIALSLSAPPRPTARVVAIVVRVSRLVGLQEGDSSVTQCL